LTDSKVALVVEDDPDQRSLYSLMLRRRGWTTLEAATAEQAQAILQDVRPAVIVLDVMLPDRDGISLCRSWRAGPDFSSIPVLVLTALGDPDTRRRALAAGADAFVSKPIAPAALVEQVQQLADKPGATLTSPAVPL
jgi:two-component system phosphate regulon response regulator PhoB